MNRNRKPFTWGVAVGLAFGACFWIYTCVDRHWRERRPYKSQFALSADQVRKVADAVRAYEAANGRRPDNLEDLVRAKRLSAADLFDAQRASMPEIEPRAGRFELNPDIVYMPALRKDDPPDLVLLCTFFTRKRGGKLLAVLNDYRIVEYSPHELVMALSRTYAYVGKQLPPSAPASVPVR